jgi:uncharacterized membrane protein YoaK (UPF0700 family)
MFRHTGKSRTMIHNLKLASLLSFVAGIVNVSGLFSVHELTTNVTGHFAYFANNMVLKNYDGAWIYLVYIASFFLGAIVSSFLSEFMMKRNMRLIYIFPVAFEITILIAIAFLSHGVFIQNANIIACSLLFAMGLQNALVTSISNSVVRTTHLTGLFTDLGIEISQLFFYKKEEQHKKLTSSIKLRLAIISFFFLGCIIGGYTYFIWGILSLLLAAACLISGLLYDALQYHLVVFKRKYF